MKSITRSLHKTAEKLTSSDVTEYDSDIKKMIQDGKILEDKTKLLIDSFECFVQPNPNLRAANSMNDMMKRSKERVSVLQEFGQSVKDVGEAVEETHPLRDHFVRSGKGIKLCGQQENVFVGNALTKFHKPLKDFMETVITPFNAGKKKLDNLRIDYDVALGKQKKATEEYSKNENDKNKALKAKADSEFGNVKEQFRSQCEIVRKLGSKINDTKMYSHNLKCLMTELIDYHKYCVNTLTSLSDNPNE